MKPLKERQAKARQTEPNERTAKGKDALPPAVVQLPRGHTNQHHSQGCLNV